MKKLYLLDTNVISEMTKCKPNSAVLEKMDEKSWRLRRKTLKSAGTWWWCAIRRQMAMR